MASRTIFESMQRWIKQVPVYRYSISSSALLAASFLLKHIDYTGNDSIYMPVTTSASALV